MDQRTTGMADLPEPAGERHAGDTAPAGVAFTTISSARYMRRRAAALLVAIGLLGLLTWTVNGTLTPRAVPAVAAPAGHARSAGRPLTAHSTRGRAARPAHAAHHAHLAPKPAAGAAGNSAADSNAGLAVTTPASASRQFCPAGDVTLSVYAPMYWYSKGQRPKFTVAAVSTASRRCEFDVGPKALALLVATGDAPVWSSADCVTGPGSRVVTLAKGLPVITWIVWPRQTATPGCHGPSRNARVGAYTATAVSRHTHSNTLIFVLGGRGVVVP